MTKGVIYTGWPLVEGYCWPLSCEPGDVVELRCSSRAARFSVVVTRIGVGRVEVLRTDAVTAPNHEVDVDCWRTGCDWPVTLAIPVDPAWPSGFYEVAFVVDEDHVGQRPADGFDQRRLRSEAFFVVRSPPASRRLERSRRLIVLSTNTYNAYNQWGGRCLYSGAQAVSFCRPTERGYLRRPAAPFDVDFDGRMASVGVEPDPEHHRLQEYQAAGAYPLWTNSAGWHNWERRFVRWAEGAGFALDYAVNADLQFVPDLLDGCHQLLTVGHDEYWSWPMRDAVDHFVDGGGGWAIFGGNTMFWQVRFEDEGRTMVCYKSKARTDDPVVDGSDASRMTGLWSDPLIGRPENRSTGLSFTRGGYYRVGQAVADGSGTYTVHQPDHWVCTGTGLASGDQLGGDSFIVGYEVDGCALDGSGKENDLVPHPSGVDGTPADLDVLATAPARLISIADGVCEAPRALWASTEPPGDLEFVAEILFGDSSPANVDRIAQGYAVMSFMRRGKGWVFNAGTTDWAYGLDGDENVRIVTANVLNR